MSGLLSCLGDAVERNPKNGGVNRDDWDLGLSGDDGGLDLSKRFDCTIRFSNNNDGFSGGLLLGGAGERVEIERSRELGAVVVLDMDTNETGDSSSAATVERAAAGGDDVL